jgi:hypothetical protein
MSRRLVFSAPRPCTIIIDRTRPRPSRVPVVIAFVFTIAAVAIGAAINCGVLQP